VRTRGARPTCLTLILSLLAGAIVGWIMSHFFEGVGVLH
jgi:hypothetical protein